MVPFWAWLAFLAVIVVMLVVDLQVWHRDAEEVGTRAAAIASAVWVAFGLGFAVVVWFWLGHKEAEAYLAGYLIEKSLSADNLFVFVLIFDYFRVPAEYQHRPLYYGILGAFVLRGVFIAAGAALLTKFSWVAFLFGLFLIYTAYKLATEEDIDVHPEDNPVLKVLRRFIPMTDELHGQRLFIRADGSIKATRLLAVLIVIETTDVVFALDSIPAIFGVTRNAFIVFSSNACALLGLRALYFLLANLVGRFRFLDRGLALILGVVGVKFIYEELVHMQEEGSLHLLPDWAVVQLPPWAPLLLVAVIMGAAIALSVRYPETA